MGHNGCSFWFSKIFCASRRTGLGGFPNSYLPIKTFGKIGGPNFTPPGRVAIRMVSDPFWYVHSGHTKNISDIGDLISAYIDYRLVHIGHIAIWTLDIDTQPWPFSLHRHAWYTATRGHAYAKYFLFRVSQSEGDFFLHRPDAQGLTKKIIKIL